MGLWREHLDAFHERRRAPVAAEAEQTEKWYRLQKSFFDAIDVRPGNLLDVGCGDGFDRLALSPDVTYFGLDPIPTGDPSTFRYVRAVAKYFPFREGTFSTVVVKAALDHFNDVEQFFVEAKRVLDRDGHLHLFQRVDDDESFLRSTGRLLKTRLKAVTKGPSPRISSSSVRPRTEIVGYALRSAPGADHRASQAQPLS